MCSLRCAPLTLSTWFAVKLDKHVYSLWFFSDEFTNFWVNIFFGGNANASFGLKQYAVLVRWNKHWLDHFRLQLTVFIQRCRIHHGSIHTLVPANSSLPPCLWTYCNVPETCPLMSSGSDQFRTSSGALHVHWLLSHSPNHWLILTHSLIR